jgi:hypothetical protein
MHKHVAIIFFLFSSGLAICQTDSVHVQRIGLGYFSEGGLYPGFTLNYEKKLLANNDFQLLLGAKAGTYFHYRNQTGVFVMVQSGQRFRLSKHFYFEHFLGVGYLHSFLNGGDAYYVTASGQIQKAHDLGNPHFMPSVSFGLSYALDQGKQPVILFARPMIFWQIPFNQVSLVQYAFEVGALFKWKK